MYLLYTTRCWKQLTYLISKIKTNEKKSDWTHNNYVLCQTKNNKQCIQSGGKCKAG